MGKAVCSQLSINLTKGSHRGIFVMRDQLILFSVKREFKKLFFVIRDSTFCVILKNLNYLPIFVISHSERFYLILVKKGVLWKIH